ncbi:MAG: CDP-alcohol phosphatidyltransferase family protein [Promethearchaeota archaeon]
MPSKYRIRNFFRPLIELIAKGMNKIGITPNMATFIMFGFSILSFISLIFLNNLLFFAICIFMCGIMDGIDGAIARLRGDLTSYGGFLDSTMDRLSEFVIFLALIIYCKDEVLWDIIDMKLIIFISFFASIMISYTRARAENFFKGDFDIGLMARSERLFYLFITMLIAFYIGFMNEFLFLYAILTLFTFIFRFYKIKTIIEKSIE